MLSSLHIARSLVAWMALALVYALPVELIADWFDLPRWPAGSEIAAVLAVPLGILLVFRSNAAYGRWWEARGLWGQLINDLRNLALKSLAHAAVGAEERRRFARLLIGFAHALRLHLRGIQGLRSVPGFEHEPADFPHAPGYVAGLIHETLNDWNRNGKLKDTTILILDPHARALMDVCGGCERIRHTPLAMSYRLLSRSGIILYALVIPWTVATNLGWWGLPVFVIGLGYLLGLELVAEVVEEPFGCDPDDLPLETYCQNVETFVAAVLDAPPTEPMKKDDFTA